MPDTPTPDSDDSLDALPPPPPVYYAEQALLGALLLEPHRLSEITGLTPASFSRPAHGALFAAISAVSAPDPDQHARNAGWLTTVLAAARQRDRALTPSYLHTLIQACPEPRHAPTYARMIEADHARRLLSTAAQHLTHRARDTSLPHPVPVVLTAADALASIIEDTAARFPHRSGIPPRAPTPPPADRYPDGQAVEEERLLLASATTRPGDIGRMRWLHSEDFSDPLHAGLWQCLTDLTRRNSPVDPITVLWQAQHHGLLHSQVEPGELLALLSEPAGSAEHWGLRVLQRALLATAHHVGRRITALTDNRALTPHQLTVGSRRALADLSALRTRWQHAISSAKPAKPERKSASAPSRAGPPTTSPPTTSSAARISR